VTRLLRLLAVVVLVLGGSQLLTTPTASARRADPVALDPSASSVRYAKQLVLTATVAAPQPDAQVDFYAKTFGAAPKLLGSATAGGDGTAKVTLPVTHTATYYAVLVLGGVSTAQSESVAVVVAPALKLTAERLLGPMYHFIATVKPAADGIPIVLQRLVGNRWKKIEKDVTEDGQLTFTVPIPGDVGSRWRLYVRGSARYGESTSKYVRVVDPRLTAH
jgi:hypothetical protein